MVEQAKKSAKDKMDKSINALNEELKKVRTGKAQVSMLDGIRVNYYGQLAPLNQVASVSTPDAKTFLIAPWETSILKDIEQGIVKSDIGMAPINDGKVIRLKVPDLTEERRKELVKVVHKKAEEAKVAVRNIRRDANDAIKKEEKAKTITEDDSKNGQDKIQKRTDKKIKSIDELKDKKEKDVLEV